MNAPMHIVMITIFLPVFAHLGFLCTVSLALRSEGLVHVELHGALTMKTNSSSSSSKDGLSSRESILLHVFLARRTPQDSNRGRSDTMGGSVIDGLMFAESGEITWHSTCAYQYGDKMRLHATPPSYPQHLSTIFPLGVIAVSPSRCLIGISR